MYLEILSAICMQFICKLLFSYFIEISNLMYLSELVIIML